MPPAPDQPRRSLERLLTEAAVALHDQPDLHLLLTWATRAACDVSAGSDAAMCTFQQDGGVGWVPMTADGSPLEEIGDPRLVEALAPLSAARLTVVEGPSVDALLPGCGWDWVAAVLVARDHELARGVMITAGHGAPPDQTDGLLALTSHLAVALDSHEARGRLHESQRQVVHRLQEALLPPPPPVDQTDLGRFYTGAENQHSTGGDLYDWIVLRNGSLHFCIVDVMGKGVSASKDAVAVTHVLRLLVLDGCRLENVVRRADSILTLQNPELVATAIVGRYDPITGKVELAGAGHPPALLVSGGQATPVEAPGIPIGWPGAGSERTTTFTLDSDASLVLYTDGLVESGRDILAGMAALAQHALQTNEYPAEHQARALVERSLEGAARYDDSLALVIRRRATADGPVRALGPFRHPIGPSTASIPLARHLLSDWLRWQPVSDVDQSDLLLAASELCTNALRHSSVEGLTATLRAWVEGLDVVVAVDDDDPTPVDLRGVEEIPDTDALSGRGLFLVQALTDGITVEPREVGKTVACRKRNAVSQHQPTGG